VRLAPRVQARCSPPPTSRPPDGDRPRGGHYIDPGRWARWAAPPRTVEPGILATPTSVLGIQESSQLLGLSPRATVAMAQDLHTCPSSVSVPTDSNGGRWQVGSGNPNPLPTSSGSAAPWSDLESLLDHFWSASRVPPPKSISSSDSFGWWHGKVAGDSRSFAEVAASPPRAPMGDGGGRFSGRGNRAPTGNRGRGRNVWQRDEVVAQTSSNNMGRGSGGSHHSGDRWEAAARGAERRQEANSPARGMLAAPGSGPTPPVTSDDPPCLNCNIRGHYTARCPTIRCERCKRLGHISQICQVVLPWECIPAMCGFQAPGRGFFYMPDHSTAKNTKERASSVVITVTGGNATSREIEHEFNIIFGDSWRCTARTIGPNQYIMRFPTPREVERAVCYGSSMCLKTVNATVRLTAWNASIGAKAPL
jgi:hypothetical protein